MWQDIDGVSPTDIQEGFPIVEQATDVWGPVPVEPGASFERKFGSLTVGLRREPSEVWVRGTHEGEATSEEWIRWAVSPDARLALRRSLPDRAIVVSPEQPFHLPPGGSARIFVRVPLFVQLVRVNITGPATVLESLPSLVLSDTWWGTFTEGELAYWVPTRARRVIEADAFDPHLAICPFLLVNRAAQPLPIERFAVRVSHLTLFGRGDAAWTDEVRVGYHGAQDGSEVRYTGVLPPEAGDVEKIAPPREAPPRGLHARTFGRLRSLAGLT